MQNTKIPFSSIIGKMIITKEGKKLGFIKDVTFETTSGELIHVIVKDPTLYTRNLNLERTKFDEILIPFSAIVARGDYVIVSEEDLI